MSTVAASIPVLCWAAERAWLSDADVEQRFRKWPLWLAGKAQPTLRQLEDFARFTHTPFGYFFLPAPPSLALPVPDFRTQKDEALAEPSSALLDTIYLCQQRQEWFAEYARMHGLGQVPFVGSVRVQDSPETIAGRIRLVLGLSAAVRQEMRTWTDALRDLVERTENAGVLVMASSIVGSNTHRKLDVGEFRGFALADELAPIIFLNAGDSKSAQMFTLAHELAHIWLGESGVSDTNPGNVPSHKTERWCNRVAAELLAPLAELRNAYDRQEPVPDAIQRLARVFKVSTLVALRRLFDAGFIDQETLWQCYRNEVRRIQTMDRGGSGGGDFYRTLGARTGKRFARAMLASTLEGHTLFQDAFRMLGVRKSDTFYQAARELGVMHDLPA